MLAREIGALWYGTSNPQHFGFVLSVPLLPPTMTRPQSCQFLHGRKLGVGGREKKPASGSCCSGFNSKVSLLLMPFGIGMRGTGKDNFNLQMKLL